MKAILWRRARQAKLITGCMTGEADIVTGEKTIFNIYGSRIYQHERSFGER
ncbi:hypothetical protein P4S64_21085 [Vibrio sp. M60_M31a]